MAGKANCVAAAAPRPCQPGAGSRSHRGQWRSPPASAPSMRSAIPQPAFSSASAAVPVGRARRSALCPWPRRRAGLPCLPLQDGGRGRRRRGGKRQCGVRRRRHLPRFAARLPAGPVASRRFYRRGKLGPAAGAEPRGWSEAGARLGERTRGRERGRPSPLQTAAAAGPGL